MNRRQTSLLSPDGTTDDLIVRSDERRTLPATVPAIVDALMHLDRNSIRYCHWKSNVRLAKSFDSRTDFDLLVARDDARQLKACLQELGLKRRHATADKTFPGMEDYLGFDASTGKLFHFHVHYTLIMGRKGQKNYRLPLEREVLETARRHPDYPIPVICPALEAVVFFLRAFLKVDFSPRSVARAMRGRTLFPRQVANEFSELQQTATADELTAICQNHFGDLTEVVPSFYGRRGWEQDSLLSLYRTRRRVFSALKPYRLFLGRELKSEVAIRRLAARDSRTWLLNGGLTVAFVGADGSGKSSTVDELTKWLGWKLRVKRVYMGLPKSRRNIARWKRLSRCARRFGLTRLQQLCNERFHLNVVSIRQQNFLLGERLKGQGGIAIFDRYPLKAFWTMDDPMDGPRLGTSSRLHGQERKQYEQIAIPDHIFVLSTTEVLSIERKPELAAAPQRAALRQKISAVDRLAASSYDNVSVIDTSQGRDACLLEIKRILWRLL